MSGGIRAVLWDFGGVITTSPFERFARYEDANGLPLGFLRGLNSLNPDTNAWSQLERGAIDVDTFVDLYEREAETAGGKIDARAVLDVVAGEIRPAMVEAVRRCHDRMKTALLTNNFSVGGAAVDYGDTLDHFDLVLESSRAGVRKPDPRFYEMACAELGIEPGDAVFLDDLGINLKPARHMGMRTIKVVDPQQALDELEQLVGFALR
ncbi:HAD-IA family hydrolase [Acidiferrimicrobium sp. IK]|uniref:HAD-IA family hydrolase n=1 Tax=Acidiferrimicrobium sp. IK TaxID=2871700 RepID=UPI0021CB549A|nr:HAD-IA family hydrolase [Acidiferrimicrobium sp. IK]MCU4183810.1 HAD-IA family hydrolase [Acidiferrimicrobium sp. IK]